jgi:UDP-N-acetylglucosamine:LPS N-acetylglucosamine transferase
MFTRQEAIPWIARCSELSRSQARQTFNLPQDATIVLLSFGGLGLDRLPWTELQQQREYFFVTTGHIRRRYGNVLVLPEAQNRYEDLIRAVDVVVTKPGYGIVADVFAHRVPLLYTERGEFPEYPRLVAALRDNAVCEFIPQEDLLAGELAPYLTALRRKPQHWPTVELHGAEVAAAKILELIDGD